METQEYDISKLILGEVSTTLAAGQLINDYAHLSNVTEDVIEKPEIASSVADIFRFFPKTDLADVLYGQHILQGVPNSAGLLPQQKLFRVNFYVLNISPLNLYEFSQLFCPRCFQNFSYRDFLGSQTVGASIYHCQNPSCSSQELQPIYKVHFVIKDKSLFNMQGGVKAVLFSSEEVCSHFFGGEKPENMYMSIAYRNKIEKYVRHILRFNVFLDAIVEKKIINDDIVLKLISCKLNKQV